jgi:hypothetical protein
LASPGDYDASGNFEWLAVARNINAAGFAAAPVLRDEYLDHPTLGGGTLGYVIHVPGHWIALAPPPAGADFAAYLCDSLDSMPYELDFEELNSFWTAIGDSHYAATLHPRITETTRIRLAARWSAYRITTEHTDGASADGYQRLTS